MEPRQLRGKGPMQPFESIWNADKDYLGLIIGFHDTDGATVYGKMTHCHEISPGLVQATVTHKNGSTSNHQLTADAPARILTQRKCPWCCAMFFPHHQDQRYCEPDHEAAQETKCRATRKLLKQACQRIGVTCLSPEKKRYFSQGEALSGAKNSRRHYGTRLTPYMCVCESWHLGRPAKTPGWLGCGQINPSIERIGHFLSAHGIDTHTPEFRTAAEEALDWYWTETPSGLLTAESTEPDATI